MKNLKLIRIYLLIFVWSGLILNSCTNKDDPKPTENQYLISGQLKTTITSQDAVTNFTALAAEAVLISPLMQYDVAVTKLTYKTTFKDKNIQASGLVCLPKAAGNYPVLSFQNGTNTEHDQAPTEAFGNDIFSILESVASMGFIVVIPDYIGFGASSQLPHPYLHAESTTQSILDMLMAAKEFANNDSVDAKPTKDLYIFGYSLGAWATMELQKTIESDYSDEFNLVASSCGAGPYSIEYMNNYITSQSTYPTPYFLTYVLNAYTYYDFVPNQLSDFIQEPYAAKIPGLFDGKHSGGSINAELTTNMTNLFTTGYRTGYATNDEFAVLKSAFFANSIHAWNTSTPTKLYHGENDEVIPISMSEQMLADFKTAGVPDSKIELITIADADHTSGIFPTGMQTILWFISFKN